MAALARLPRGSGIVFRHQATPPAARRRLYESVRAMARRRRLVLVLAGPPALAIAWRADGAHGPSRHVTAPRALLRTLSAHDRAELCGARRRRADLAFLSPVFATRSHPGARALGVVRFGLIRRCSSLPIVALGGLNAARYRALGPIAYGWAAIDAWCDDQKRKVVPR